MVEKEGYHFARMHGLGNKILVLESRFQARDAIINRGLSLLYHKGGPIELLKKKFIEDLDIRSLSDRCGYDFDQLMIVEKIGQEPSQYVLDIYNKDGTRALACGNGTRCAARFLQKRSHQKYYKFISFIF